MTESVSARLEEERNILNLAGQLCEQLGIRFRPTGIVWTGTIGRPLDLPSDLVGVIVRRPKPGHIVLPTALMGRLELREWKPLLASALIREAMPSFRRTLIYVKVAYFALTLLWLLGILLAMLMNLLGAGITQFLPGVILILFLASLYTYVRASRLVVLPWVLLRADKAAARVLGTEQFVNTLVKIDGMHLQDLEEIKGKRRGSRFFASNAYPWPTIEERIRNLQVLTGND